MPTWEEPPLRANEPLGEPISEEDLRAAACWFPNADRVSGNPEMTAFKQEARLRQSRWRGDLAMGSHTNTRNNIAAVAEQVTATVWSSP
jgi:hypothetical protein